MIGGVVGVLALGGAGLAYAESGHGAPGQSAAFASSSSSSTTTPDESGPRPVPGMRGPFRMGRFGGFGLGLGLGPALAGPGAVVHGEYTVRSGNSYKTVAVQVGQVTAVSSTSITVKSSDGYKHSYTVVASTRVDAQAGGISSVKTGDQVSVLATVQGSTFTAVSITDATRLKATHTYFGFGEPAPAPGRVSAAADGPSLPQ
jgi:hypothetical protein